jgi:hypothetical protein
VHVQVREVGPAAHGGRIGHSAGASSAGGFRPSLGGHSDNPGTPRRGLPRSLVGRPITARARVRARFRRHPGRP